MKPAKVAPHFEPAVNHLRETLTGLRSGRASTALVDGLVVELYGAQVSLRDLASVTVSDARTIVIEPWDPSAVPAVEKALVASPLGVTPAVAGTVLRVQLPPLTEERRKELARLLGQHTESARISVRNVREKLLREFRRRQDDGELSDDAFAKAKDALQREVDTALAAIAALGREKEAELLA